MWDQIASLGVPLIGGIATVLTIYFASKKIGYHIDTKYSIVGERSFDTRITNIVIKNKKDKTETIHAIYAVIDREFYLELKRFDDPLILGANESYRVDTLPYSYSMVNDDIYVQNYTFSKIEIYVQLFDKTIKCDKHTYWKSNLDFKLINKITNTYNNIIYNLHVSYILVYVLNGETNTAFIYDSGSIQEEWKLHYNFIKPADGKITPNEITEFLRLYYPEIPAYELLKLNNQTLRFDTIKKHNLN